MLTKDEIMLVLIKPSRHNSQIMFTLTMLKKTPHGNIVPSIDYDYVIEMFVDDNNGLVNTVRVERGVYDKVLERMCDFMRTGIIDSVTKRATVVSVHPHSKLAVYSELIPESIVNNMVHFEQLLDNPPNELIEWLYSKLPEELTYTRNNKELYYTIY